MNKMSHTNKYCLYPQTELDSNLLLPLWSLGKLHFILHFHNYSMDIILQRVLR